MIQQSKVNSVCNLQTGGLSFVLVSEKGTTSTLQIFCHLLDEMQKQILHSTRWAKGHVAQKMGHMKHALRQMDTLQHILYYATL